jgi:phloretin hydrolase
LCCHATYSIISFHTFNSKPQSMPVLSIGFDPARFKEGAETAVGSVQQGMTHVARKVGSGIELRTRFWLPPGTPVAVLKALTYHALEEYAHLANLLPALYQEFGPDVTG